MGDRERLNQNPFYEKEGAREAVLGVMSALTVKPDATSEELEKVFDEHARFDGGMTEFAYDELRDQGIRLAIVNQQQVEEIRSLPQL